MNKEIKKQIIEILREHETASTNMLNEGISKEKLDACLEIDNEFADQLSELVEEEKQKWLEENIPREKIRPLESFVNKKIGAEYEHYKKGYNDCLKDVKEKFSTPHIR